jgi:nitrite reductase/ring-hydroxylating ferredoxin subunit
LCVGPELARCVHIHQESEFFVREPITTHFFVRADGVFFYVLNRQRCPHGGCGFQSGAERHLALGRYHVSSSL